VEVALGGGSIARASSAQREPKADVDRAFIGGKACPVGQLVANWANSPGFGGLAVYRRENRAKLQLGCI